MSLLEYNIRNVFVILLFIIAVCFIIYKIINKISIINENIIIKPIIIIFAILILFVSCFIFWETNAQQQEGTVTECIKTGSIGDAIVNYTFYIIDDNGNEMTFNTPILSSKKYINELESINTNDKIIIKYGKKLHYAFNIEKQE